MTVFDAILLGIIQGLTEFLPVSSSGHLTLMQHLLGFKHLEHYLLFDLACHSGTLCAIFVIFKKDIANALSWKSERFWQVALATLPLLPLVFLMKPIKAAFNSPELLGVFFLVTAVILWSGDYFKGLARAHPWRNALAVGVSQAVAIFPGISRSGTTITVGRLMGWSVEEALSFSFLLAIPAILGGTCYELLNQIHSVATLPFTNFAAGFLTSFGVGLSALKLLMKLASKNRFRYFAWYCASLGLFTLFYFNHF